MILGIVMKSDFLLTAPLARRLYHQYAEGLPVIDYHNHLSLAQLQPEYRFENISQLWINTDPYKHRVMRILGVQERLITGDSTDYEKFCVWYQSLPRLIGNPLFDWSVMEIQTVFDYALVPFGDPEKIWNTLNEKLKNMTAQDILGKFHIAYSAPCAALDWDLTEFQPEKGISPSLRGDDLLMPKPEYIRKLGDMTGTTVHSLEDYLSAIRIRLDAFRDAGCRFTDHALDNGFTYIPDDGKNEQRFEALLQGQTLENEDKVCLSSAVLTLLAGEYARCGFTLQLHIGAQRTTSTRLRELAGPAGGYAAMGSTADLQSLTVFLDTVEKLPHGLPQILLFTLNPADNAVFATLSGSYSKDGCQALVSQGPAWWWCDHYQGMEQMLDTFASHSVLSTFVGMTTDSRSLLSFVRHDYFRRVLCQWIATKVAQGRLPEDETLLADLIKKVCYENAKMRLERE